MTDTKKDPKERDPWYVITEPGAPLTQGDIVRACPVLVWNENVPPPEGDAQQSKESPIKRLSRTAVAAEVDVVVMTQACDLEQNNVSNVVLCSNFTLEEFRAAWAKQRTSLGKKVRNEDWSGFCKGVKQGFVWGFSLLELQLEGTLTTQVRIVNFQEIYTIPRSFLDSLIAERNEPRLQLRSPYREHLSQAFARYFMRVGLPTAVTAVWEKPQTQAG